MSDIPDDNWSERDDRNAEVAPLGFPPGLPAQIELIGRMMMGAIKRFWNKANPAYVTTGTADAYVVTPESQTSFIHIYEIVRLRIDRANTTATPTLKFGQTNARVIVKVSPSGYVPLIAGDLVAGQDHSFWYNGTSYVLSNPGTVDSASTMGVLKTANNLSELTPTATTARTNIGLGNVDNTSDANKPVSGPQATAISSSLAAAMSYTDTLGALKLSLTGGTMSGVINMGSQKVTNLANGTASGDAVNKSQLDSVFAGTTQSKSADYTVVATDKGAVINVDASGASRTITLLAAATAGAGFTLVVKKSDSSANTVTVDGNASETIDGAITRTLSGQYQAVSMVCDGTTWRVVADIGLKVATSQSTVGAPPFGFLNIPPWVKRVTAILDQMSLTGTDDILVQGGTASGYETTGYTSGSAGAVTSSSGFIIRAGSSTRAATGHMVLTNLSGNIWVSSHAIHLDSVTDVVGGGRKGFAGTLDRIRFTTTGTDTGDLGSVTILYE